VTWAADGDAGGRSALLRDDWTYVPRTVLDDFVAADWTTLNAQRATYMAEQRAVQALEMLAVSAAAPSFGYAINNYRHCLQTATMMLRDGREEEDIVVGLFHDIGFIVCNESHGAFAAALLRPFAGARSLWMLEHHAEFQTHHIHDCEGCDPRARDRWHGHQHFAWTAEFIERYDQRALDPKRETLPLTAFDAMVRRFFARPPRACPPT
jgi:predicted HD phosphohydrolase